MITFEKGKDKEDLYLSLDATTFDEWLASHIMCDKVAGKGKDSYLNSLVQMTDYIINPSIPKKNSFIIEELT